MVKPLTFKGDKKSSKKRKRPDTTADSLNPTNDAPSTDLTTTTPAPAPPADPSDDDTWVTADTPADITGPIVLVLPTTPPTALSSDANGKVFTLPLENMLNSDPSTAEPHDVRQVWVATRIAGTDGHSFKGHHGRYLSCDKFGVLSATREAISPEETFQCVAVPEYGGGAFGVQTQREGFVAAEEGGKGTVEVRGDAEGMAFKSTLRVRMQARFKPRVKRNREEKAREKVSRKELEEVVGRRLEEGEVKTLKRARKEGNYHEALLDVKVKSKHDKFA